MVKLTREGFIHLLESGKYEKITGKLTTNFQTKSGKGQVCAIGAALKETGNLSKTPAKGFSYLPKQLVEDLQITPETERKIFTTNDTTGDDNWAAVVAMLRKEWNITGDCIPTNVYELEQALSAYMTDYYPEITPVENYGYNVE